jgi:glycosyltransferase involved in cell wall biosynthesis
MISVILSTYNDEKTIFDCINSILNQTYQNFEFIIINDCSKDGTKKIIQSFSDKRIVYLENKKNIGRSISRNKGIEKAKGEFIAIIDGDDIAAPFRLDIQLKYLNNNPKIDLVASNVIFFYENRVVGSSKLKLHKSNIFNFYLRASEMPHPTWMARIIFLKNLSMILKWIEAKTLI